MYRGEQLQLMERLSAPTDVCRTTKVGHDYHSLWHISARVPWTLQSQRSQQVCTYVSVCVGVWSPTCLSVQHQEYTEMMRLCDEPCVRGMRCFVVFVFFFNSLFIYAWEGEALSRIHTEERQNFTRLYTPWSRPYIYVGVCKTYLNKHLKLI